MRQVKEEPQASAAVGKAIRAQNHSALGPVEPDAAEAPAEPSIFESPRHEAGDIDHDATQGRTLIWHNEDCFTELRFPPSRTPTH